MKEKLLYLLMIGNLDEYVKLLVDMYLNGKL